MWNDCPFDSHGSSSSKIWLSRLLLTLLSLCILTCQRGGIQYFLSTHKRLVSPFNLCTHGLFVMQVHTLNGSLNYLSWLCTSGLDSGRSLGTRLHQGKFTWPLCYIPNSQDFFCSCSWEHVWPARPRETLSDSAGSVLQLYSAYYNTQEAKSNQYCIVTIDGCFQSKVQVHHFW